MERVTDSRAPVPKNVWATVQGDNLIKEAQHQKARTYFEITGSSASVSPFYMTWIEMSSFIMQIAFPNNKASINPTNVTYGDKRPFYKHFED